MKKQQKVENQESKYDKAQSALLSLLEQVMSNLDSQIEKRLNQDRIQNVKKYYLEEYRHFFEFKYLIFVFLGSFVLYYFFENGENSFLGLDKEESYMFFGIFAIVVIVIRYMYDEGQSTRIYIEKLLGHFDSEEYNPSEIIEYLEKKIFLQNVTIRYMVYIVLALATAIALYIGSYFDKPILLGSIVVLSAICLFDMPFIKIKKFKKR